MDCLNEYFIDISHETLPKFGEELKGDIVRVERLDDCSIVVMSDGLGSGVKANILSTLTSSIAITMLKEGADIYETLDTIANTLPVCKVREVAYSTFTFLKIYKDGRVYCAEYDNPELIILRNGTFVEIEKNILTINGKKIKESHFKLEENDALITISDGVVHAGLGERLNLGWQWEDIKKYLEKSSPIMDSAKDLTKDLIETCWSLYFGHPGDDTTVVSIKLKRPRVVNLFTGPPKDKSKDSEIIKSFMDAKGLKVVCGGTAANIVERELNKKIKVHLDYLNPDVPPIATIEGIDLVTEGVLTLSKTLDKLKLYEKSFDENCDKGKLKMKNASCDLFKVLVNCTHLTLWMGTAINEAHQNVDFPAELSIKLRIVDDICTIMRALGKVVVINKYD